MNHDQSNVKWKWWRGRAKHAERRARNLKTDRDLWKDRAEVLLIAALHHAGQENPERRS